MINNTYTIKLDKNPRFHDWTKHMNTKYHLIWHHVESKIVHLQHCSTNEQIVDIFTKALGWEMFERFRTMLGLTKSPSDEEGNVGYLILRLCFHALFKYCKYIMNVNSHVGRWRGWLEVESQPPNVMYKERYFPRNKMNRELFNPIMPHNCWMQLIP